MNLSQNRHYVIQHVFHLFQILKLEPNFLGIRFFHILRMSETIQTIS